MIRIGVCGHLGGNKVFLDGQTVKTKIVINELKKTYGEHNVKILDTYGGKSKLLFHVLKLFSMLIHCKNVIILPGENSLRLFAPILVLTNTILQRRLHYVVIGGWLPEFLKKRKILLYILKRFNAIYVETESMKQKLESYGLKNVSVLPNCKELTILSENELILDYNEPLKLCTFSRVMKEKGIEDAVNAVIEVNKQLGRQVFKLDIYGQVDSSQKDWFYNLEKQFPNYIRYQGLVDFDKSTEVLKDYFGLLFPTYYKGEGFAGTLIDAMAAGVPVIATNWKYNSEIIVPQRNGLLIDNNDMLQEKLLWIFNHSEEWISMKKTTLADAQNYIPQNALKKLLMNLD